MILLYNIPMEQIVTTIISSVCLLIGTIVTVLVTNSKLKKEIELRQQFQQTEIDDLKKSLKEHNNYAKTIPIIETEIDYIKNSIEGLKK